MADGNEAGAGVFAEVLRFAGDAAMPEAEEPLLTTRAGLDALRDEIEKLVADRPRGVLLCERTDLSPRSRGHLDRLGAAAAGGARVVVLGEPEEPVPDSAGEPDIFPPRARVPRFVPRADAFGDDWFVLARGSGSSVALVARAIAEPANEPRLARYRALLTFARGAVERGLDTVRRLSGEVAPDLHDRAGPTEVDFRREVSFESLLPGRLASRVGALTGQFHRHTLVDALTGLFNQRYFYESLVREANRFNRRQRGFSLLYLEVGGDPSPAVADAAVRGLADILRTALRRGGDLPCRLGERQFGILFDETHDKEAAAAALRIESAFAELNLPRCSLKIRLTACVTGRAVSSVLAMARNHLREGDF